MVSQQKLEGVPLYCLHEYYKEEVGDTIIDISDRFCTMTI